MKWTNLVALSAVPCAGVSLLAGAACAQTVDAKGSGIALEEIVVTAERREANLQDAPLAIQAVTGDTLKKAGVQSTLDLKSITPGLLVTTNTASAQIYVRGIGSNFGGGQSVAVHVDGVYQVTSATALQDFLDVERVEVLKGPQGTLYGRNATGGVVNVISRRPTNDPEAEVSLEIGNFNKFRETLTLNAPLVEDKVLGRFAIMRTDRDGYRKNPFLGNTIDDEHNLAARGMLLFQGEGAANLLLVANYSQEDDSRTLGFKINSNVFAPQVDLLPTFGLQGGTVPADPDVIYSNRKSIQHMRQYGMSATGEVELGPVKLKSITAVQRNTKRQDIDVDGTEVDYFNSISPGDTTTWYSQEFQFSNLNPDKLEWVGGLFLLKQDQETRNFFTTPVFDQLGISQGPIFADADDSTAAVGLYGQATYHLTEKLSATAGLRYSWEETKNTNFVGGRSELGPLNSVSEKWSATTPKFGIEYKPTEDVMVYASVTKGFKSGGIDQGSQEIYAPEFIWSYEAGAKSSWFDKRLRLNADVFYYDYSNIQIIQALAAPDPISGAVQRVGNAAAATVKGAEFELSALPIRGLQITAYASLLDTRYDQYLTVNSERPGSPPVDLSGNRLPNAPRFAGSLSAKYSWDVGSAGAAYVQGDVYHQSKIYFSSFNDLNDEFDQERPYTTLGARAGFTGANGRWHVDVYGRNLTNVVYRQTVIRAVGFFGQLDILAAPRTYGVEFGYRF